MERLGEPMPKRRGQTKCAMYLQMGRPLRVPRNQGKKRFPWVWLVRGIFMWIGGFWLENISLSINVQTRVAEPF